MRPYRASIVIDNFNYGRFLKDSIDSALAQTYSSTEVLVVDDGSTDDSREVIASFGDRIVSVLKANGGQASALNAGFAASRGEVILFLDADDLLVPTAVKRALALFDSPDVAKVHGPVLELDARGMPTGRIIPRTVLPEGNLRPLLARDGPDACATAPLQGNAFSRPALELVFPIPEEFRNHADIYPVTMASVYGVTRRMPEPLGYYRMHGGNFYASQSLAEKNRRNLRVYDLRCRYLSEHLRKLGCNVGAEDWKEGHAWYDWMQRLDMSLAELEKVIPEGDSFILVDNAEWADGWAGSSVVENRQVIPFLERDGAYWGAPLDDETGIRELERLRRSGASYIAVAWPAFWWFDHYQRFTSHLRTSSRTVLANERLVIFDLRA